MSSCGKVGRKEGQGGKDSEEELYHKAGPQGLCEDDSQRKHISEPFRVRRELEASVPGC